MKTSKHFRFPVNLKLLLVLPVFAVAIVTMISCGQSKNQDTGLNELVPPVPPPPENIFEVVDELPQFKGGDAGLLKYIADSTRYPEQAVLNNITGRVIVKLVVEKDCSVSNVEIEKGADSLLEAEAIRVVSSLPRFEKPGKKGGEAVRVRYMVPITFALK
jgi:periplasmic protein TonB